LNNPMIQKQQHFPTTATTGTRIDAMVSCWMILIPATIKMPPLNMPVEFPTVKFKSNT
jgi:hypothetical protein